MRFFIYFMAVFGAATPSFASTIEAEYFARSRITVSVSSATFVGTNEDAYGFLSVGAWQDASDEGVDEIGGGQYSGYRNDVWGGGAYEEREFILEYSAFGSASRETPYSSSWIGGWITPTLDYWNCATRSCEGEDDIWLILDYTIEKDTYSNSSENGVASAEAGGNLLIEYLGYETGSRNGRLNATSGSGSFSILLHPGDGIGLDFNLSEGVGGYAQYTPTEVPLPLPATMLTSGFALFFLVRRRTKIHV